MNELVLIRGLPGSGKTTMARKLQGYTHYEADMYFQRYGKYHYEARKLALAHQWCQRKTRNALKRGKNVVVSNTFTRLWEMQAYLEMGHPLRIVEATGNWGNIHHIPESVIIEMRERWECIDDEVLKKINPIA